MKFESAPTRSTAQGVGGLREALETLVSERSVFFRAVARSQGGGFQGGGILIGVLAPPELRRSTADYGKRRDFSSKRSFSLGAVSDESISCKGYAGDEVRGGGAI